MDQLGDQRDRQAGGHWLFVQGNTYGKYLWISKIYEANTGSKYMKQNS